MPVTPDKKPPSPQSRVRVTFHDKEGGEVIASLWAQYSAGPSPALLLLHDYPDFRPVAGWRVKGRGINLVIKAVDGRKLTCEKLASASTAAPEGTS